MVEPDILGLLDTEWILVPLDLPCLQIERAAQQPSVSHIAAPAASWVDDFLSWARCFHRTEEWHHHSTACRFALHSAASELMLVAAYGDA